jgi:aminopeptidase
MTTPNGQTGFDEATLERLADLVVGFAANVQEGQIVAIGAELGKEEMVRALASSAYRHGARFVDVTYLDLHVKRARILHAREEYLDFVPSWFGERLLALGDQRCARIGLTGPADPHVLEGLDPARAGRDQFPFLKETGRIVDERTTNWTALPCPTRAWARLVHPELDDDAALARLCEQLLHVCRLDEPDPIASWRERQQVLVDAAQRLSERRFDALRYTGSGTDLTVGLLGTSTWQAAAFETVDGLRHMPNLPSEEIFTSPDPERTQGVVRSTKPLVLAGTIIRGLEVEFDRGRAVRIDADENAEVLRGYAARDDGAARLGEVALVDGQGRIGALDTVFFDTLLDENAASHIALGASFAFVAGEEDRARLNSSAIHVDFMVGGDGVDVFGVTPQGDEVPVLVGGEWRV